jgi:peptide/nickel transport system permease protein
MVDNLVTSGEFLKAPPRYSEWKRFRRVFFSRGVVVFGLVILILLAMTAIFAPWLAPYDPYKLGPGESLLQPSKDHLLGTDRLGRDTLSRLIYGSQTALMVGFISVISAGIVGIGLGLIAGYFPGATNMLIMRLMDALMCFPMLLLALVVAAVLGEGIWNVIIALSIATVPGYARVTHGLALSLKENDYVLAGRVVGSSSQRIILRDILPNAFPTLIVLMTMQLGNLILAEAMLSFLGIGIDPPQAAWGAMVEEGRNYLRNYPVLSFAPCLAIMLVVFAFNMVGDGLRDALDPRLRGLI